MTWGPDLRSLARAAEGRPRRPGRSSPSLDAESFGFDLHYDENPQMGLLGSDLVVLDREHRRIAAMRGGGPIGAVLFEEAMQSPALPSFEIARHRIRPLPRRDGLVVEAARRGSFDLESVGGEALDSALRNPEAYASFLARVIRWAKVKIRRRRPDGETEEEDIDSDPTSSRGGDDRECLSPGVKWRGRWKYPDGTEIEIEYES